MNRFKKRKKYCCVLSLELAMCKKKKFFMSIASALWDKQHKKVNP